MPPRILIIDDDPAIRTVVAEALTDEGYEVGLATNGAEGLAALEAAPPALVLLDMRMPVLDGWGFAQALRQQPAPPPLVAMTAAQEARRWGEEIGAAAVLAKPFNLLELLEVVQRLAEP